MEKIIYLDNAATTKPFDELADIYKNCCENFYNPSAVYNAAVSNRLLIDKTRTDILKAIGGISGNLIFTSGATEANNIALNSVRLRANNNIAVGITEHPSIFNKAKQLQNSGANVIYLKVDEDGRVCDLEKCITPSTVMLSVMHVNNETGAINNIKQIVQIARKINPKIIVHVDGVQALGKIKLNLMDLDVDMYTLSAHKIHGPKGIGALWVKNGIKVNPLVYGGQQENGLRSGTENLFGILAFGYCVSKQASEVEQNYNYVSNVKNAFLNELTLNNVDYCVNGGKNALPYILSVSFKNFRGEVLLHALEKHNILISTGSACSSKKPDNRTLRAMGKNDNQIMGSVRISFSAYDKYDIKQIASVFSKEVKALQIKIGGKN